jgi:hypothetical protein
VENKILTLVRFLDQTVNYIVTESVVKVCTYKVFKNTPIRLVHTLLTPYVQLTKAL